MTTTTTKTKQRVIAVLDVDAPAKVVTHRTPMLREPDGWDDGRATWIGDNAVVSVDVDKYLNMGTVTLPTPLMSRDFLDLVTRGGTHALHGKVPGEFGIDVDLFASVDQYARDYAAAPLNRHKGEYVLWSYVQHTMLVNL